MICAGTVGCDVDHMDHLDRATARKALYEIFPQGVYKRWEQAWAESNGYTPVIGAAPCPRRVAGKRCRIGMPSGDRCICEYRFLDHSGMWRDVHGDLVFTSEPYQLPAQDLAAFELEIKVLGLELDVSGRGRWAPTVIALTVWRLPTDPD